MYGRLTLHLRLLVRGVVRLLSSSEIEGNRGVDAVSTRFRPQWHIAVHRRCPLRQRLHPTTAFYPLGEASRQHGPYCALLLLGPAALPLEELQTVSLRLESSTLTLSWGQSAVSP